MHGLAAGRARVDENDVSGVEAVKNILAVDHDGEVDLEVAHQQETLDARHLDQPEAHGQEREGDHDVVHQSGDRGDNSDRR